MECIQFTSLSLSLVDSSEYYLKWKITATHIHKCIYIPRVYKMLLKIHQKIIIFGIRFLFASVFIRIRKNKSHYIVWFALCSFQTKKNNFVFFFSIICSCIVIVQSSRLQFTAPSHIIVHYPLHCDMYQQSAM